MNTEVFELLKTELERIKNTLGDIDKKLDEHTELHVKNTADLKYHIKRTDMLEADVKPMRAQLSGIKFFLMLVGAVGVVLSIILTIRQFLT